MITHFADPWMLLLLVLLPVVAYLHLVKEAPRRSSLRYSDLGMVVRAGGGVADWVRHIPLALRVLVLGAFIMALARPQSASTTQDASIDGIDIVMVLDISSSMLAEDLAPNRLEAAKEVGADFVDQRRNDRVGLVVFAGRAFTQAPLTVDHDAILNVLAELRPGMVEDGTAVGLGLATALRRLESSTAESRVVVLLTDGRNNRGEIDPVTAAQMGAALGVKVYTIGAGSRGMARVPIDPTRQRYATVQADVDEPTLQEMADITGGRYFRATDRERLEEVYTEIDDLETTQIQVERYTRYSELFHIPLMAGLGLLLLELGLSRTVLRRIP